MGELWRDMQLAGMDDAVGRPVPVQNAALMSVQPGVILGKEGNEDILKVSWWVDDYTPPTWEQLQQWKRKKLSHEEIESIPDAFLALAGAPDSDYLQFANVYGLLGLCDEHGVPNHYSRDGTTCSWTYAEPVRHWRRLIDMLLAILRISTELHWNDVNRDKEPRLGAQRDWAELAWGTEGWPDDRRKFENGEWMRPVGEETRAEILSLAKLWIEVHVNSCLNWVDMRPQLKWQSGKPRMEFTGRTIWSAIASRVLFRVISGKESAVCGECGAIYPTSRKPRADQRNYCPDCGNKGIPDRDRKRVKRANKRQEQLSGH